MRTAMEVHEDVEFFKNFLISQHGPSLSGLGQCANFDLLGSRLRDRHE